MKDLSAEVERLSQGGYAFSGSYIRQGWDLFRADAGAYIGFTIVFFIISMVINAIPVIGMAGSLVTTVIAAGFYLYAHKDANQQNPSFGDFFGGFAFAAPLIIQQLIVWAATAALFSPLLFWFVSAGFFSGEGDFAANVANGLLYSSAEPPMWVLWAILPLTLVSIYFGICISFSTQFILFGGMNAWEAMTSSYQVIRHKWWTILGFLLALGLLNIVGAIFLGVGLLITVPVTVLAIYAAFADLFSLNGDSTDDLISEFGADDAA